MMLAIVSYESDIIQIIIYRFNML